VAANQPSQPLKYQKEGRPASVQGSIRGSELGGGPARRLPSGQKLPKGAILEPFAPRLAGKGYHVLKTRDEAAEGRGDCAASSCADVQTPPREQQGGRRAGVDAVMNRAASTFKDAQGGAQEWMRRVCFDF
jgi:hypothetical protein